MRTWVRASAWLLAMTMFGCAAGEPAASVSVPLTSAAANGGMYRLTSATFELGTPGGRSAMLTAEDDAASLEAVLAAGSYSIRLLDGWQLEAIDPDGTITPVSASLVSPNPVGIDIASGIRSEVRFRFRAGRHDVELGEGTLGVDIEVEETHALQEVVMSAPLSINAIGFEDLGVPPALTLPMDLRLALGSDLLSPAGTLPEVATLPCWPVARVEARFGAQPETAAIADWLSEALVRARGELCVQGDHAILVTDTERFVSVVEGVRSAHVEIDMEIGWRDTATGVEPVLVDEIARPIGIRVSANDGAPRDVSGFTLSERFSPASALECIRRTCRFDADCPGTGQQCAGGECFQRATYCIGDHTSVNAIGEVTDCFDMRCNVLTGTCIREAQSGADCAIGFVWDASLGLCVRPCGEADDEGNCIAPAYYSTPIGIPVVRLDAVCAPECGSDADCSAGHACRGGYCVYGAYCAGRNTVRRWDAGRWIDEVCPGNYTCDAALGQCLTSCTDSAQCMSVCELPSYGPGHCI